MRKLLSKTKALADKNRLRALIALTGHDELCVCRIIEMLELAPATVSRHMSVLLQADLVDSRKNGKWVFYRLSDRIPKQLLKWLKDELKGSSELASDQKNMKRILACDLDELCKARRRRKRNFHD